jgi:hypothetical protein
MATGPVALFDYDYVCVTIVDQRVDECHSACAGADNQIVRFKRRGP